MYDLTMTPEQVGEAQEMADKLGLDLEDYCRASLLDDSNSAALLEWARKLVRHARINVIVSPPVDRGPVQSVDPGLDD